MKVSSSMSYGKLDVEPIVEGEVAVEVTMVTAGNWVPT